MQPDTKPRGAYWSALLVVPWPRGFVPLIPGVGQKQKMPVDLVHKKGKVNL